MKILSAIATAWSGSLGGITASRNKGGMYLRGRATPTDPQTASQTTVRNAMQFLTNYWTNVLSAANRADWETYAQNVSKIDALGQTMKVSGQNWFVGNNVPRLQAGEPRVDTGPGIFDVGEFTEPAFDSIDAGANQADISFESTDDWVSEDGAFMFVYISRPQNPTVNFFKGPYRFAGTIAGDSITPPTSPMTLNLPFPVVAGQRIFSYARVARADGRLSGIVRFQGIA